MLTKTLINLGYCEIIYSFMMHGGKKKKKAARTIAGKKTEDEDEKILHFTPGSDANENKINYKQESMGRVIVGVWKTTLAS